MTRRERLERKIEKRNDWAAGRTDKAAALLKQNEPYRGDHAFNTQPGHIPERARAIRRSDKAAEHYAMQKHHEAKADGLRRQLDRTIFSDDGDAIQQLQARIENLEMERDRMKAINVAWRKAGKPAPAGDAAHTEAIRAAWQQIADAVGMNVNDLGPVRRRIIATPYHPMPFPPYALTNLAARIRTDKKRIESVRRQQEQTAKAEDAGGTVIEEVPGGYVRVTFAEFPGRDTINTLKAAGFHWSRPSWYGKADALPELPQ